MRGPTFLCHVAGAVVLCLTTLLGACTSESEPRVNLYVQLVTDFAAGEEFSTIEVEVEGADGVREIRAQNEPFLYLEPQRIADLRDLPKADARRIVVSLRSAAGKRVIERAVVVAHQTSLTRTVVITRSCQNVSCEREGTRSCLSGACVSETCVDGSEASCGDGARACTRDKDCEASACHVARCVYGSCLDVEDQAACSDAGASADAGMVEGSDGGATVDLDGGTLPDGGVMSPLDCDASVCRLDAACARHTFKQRFYWLCQKTRTYADAQALCAADGTTLVIINDQEENAFVASLIRSATGATGRNAPYYIGLDDQMAEGSFVWVDGSAPSYSQWESSTPNNGTANQCMSENCATIFANGNWNDVCCLGAQPFICEKQ